jgi:hypothetical protein
VCASVSRASEALVLATGCLRGLSTFQWASRACCCPVTARQRQAGDAGAELCCALGGSEGEGGCIWGNAWEGNAKTRRCAASMHAPHHWLILLVASSASALAARQGQRYKTITKLRLKSKDCHDAGAGCLHVSTPTPPRQHATTGIYFQHQTPLPIVDRAVNFGQLYAWPRSSLRPSCLKASIFT